MQIKVEHIPKTGLELNTTIAVSDLATILPQEQGFSVKEPAEVSLSISTLKGRVLIEGRWSVVFEAECARCLKHFSLRLARDDLRHVFVKPGKNSAKTELTATEQPPTAAPRPSPKRPAQGAHTTSETYVLEEAEAFIKSLEYEADENNSSEYDGKIVPWGDVVLEQIVLHTPFAPRCQEKCLGICAQCGVDRNSVMCQCEQPVGNLKWQALRAIQLG